MKKISLFLTLVMLLTAFTAVSVNAGIGYVVELGDINMPIATPTVDGVVNSDEGWSSNYLFDQYSTCPFWGHNAMTSSGDMYFAYSAEGIYYATVITELNHLNAPNQNGDPTDYDGNSFVYSTGLDDVNPKIIETENTETGETETEYKYVYGFNGDVVTFMIDPNTALLNAGYTGNNDYTPWYNVGLFKDGTAKMYRSQVNEGYLTEEDGVKVAATAKEDLSGWTMEAFIPWSVIVEDIYALSFGDVDISVDEISAQGYMCKAAIMYMDRFNDVEAGAVDTWGRWITVCERSFDGTPGFISSGDCLKTLGLTLINASNNPFEDVEEGKWYYDAAIWCNNKGFITGTSKTTFAPNNKLTRAQFVQILAKVAGADLNSIVYTDKFTDVPDGKWFTKAVLWAVDNQITSGIGGGKFGPNNYVSRQQLATFIYTYVKSIGANVSKLADITGYTDYSSVATWARTPLAWAVGAGLINSTSTTAKTLSPNGIATRGQAALIIKNLYENIIDKK